MVDVSAVLFRADALGDLGQHEKAIALLGTALAEEPSNASLLVTLSNALYATGRVEEAIAAADATLAVDPGSIGAKATLAKAALQQSRFDDALRIAEEMLEADPLLPQAHLLRAIALAYGDDGGLGSRREQAREPARRALELAADEPSYYQWAAVVERRLGDEEAALQFARAGLAIDPNSTKLLEFLAVSTTTTTRDRLSIFSSLLAENPMDDKFRTRILRERRSNRRSRYDLQWMSVVAAVGTLTFFEGILSGVGTVLVFAGAFVVWKRRSDAVAALPERFATRGGRTPAIALRVLLVLWVIALVTGTGLLMAEVALGSVLLVIATVAWACSVGVVDLTEFRAAAFDDDLTETAEAPVFAWRQLGRSLRAAAILVAAGLGTYALDAVVVTAVCELVALALLIECLVLFRASAALRPPGAVAVVLIVLGALAAGLGSLALSELPATATWSFPEPTEGGPGDEPSDGPLPLPSFEAPEPSFSVPSISIPPIVVPSFDLPTPSPTP